MKKVRIIKNKKTYFESHFYTSYENKKIIEIDFNDLHDANLRCTDLYNADLSGANLNNADLRDANLNNANLHNANLRSVKLDKKEMIRKGKIINKKTFVYKKCQNKIVKLELQTDSIVFSINKGTIRKENKLFNVYEVYVPSHELKTNEFAILLNGLVEECKNQGIETRSYDEIRRDELGGINENKFE